MSAACSASVRYANTPNRFVSNLFRYTYTTSAQVYVNGYSLPALLLEEALQLLAALCF